MKNSNKICHCEHSHKLLTGRIPKGRGSDSVVHQGKKGLLDHQLDVKYHQLGRGWNEIVTGMIMEKFYE